MPWASGRNGLLTPWPASSLRTMANRHGDWLRQSEADLRHAWNSLEADYYTAGEAEAAIADAEAILEFCRGALG